MNPNIKQRWGLLCPSCSQKLINPNQPWPTPCDICGQRTHLKCHRSVVEWTVTLDLTTDRYKVASVCRLCFEHGKNNDYLIEQIPHGSGAQLHDVYAGWKAKQPPAPVKPVTSLWGEYRIDPTNFVPAVTKVLDIVHSGGPKVRWAVKLTHADAVPMTNLSSKEIILPNYFDSPQALGKTHQEILDAMTGAAMHEAGHAAYDKADTMREAQRRIQPGLGQATWAAATCLNIVCDYNLERRVLERYPAFRHYFAECHRWSVEHSLPTIVQALKEGDAENKLNVRLAVTVWEMLAPGDLANAGGVITPKLQWITDKCFSILKYGYDKGHLNTEPGKLKVARAIYELVRVVNPVGAPQDQLLLPPMPPGPQGQQPNHGQPGQGQQPPQGGTPQPGTGQGSQPTQGDPASDDVTEADQDPEGTVPTTPGDPGRPGTDDEDTEDESDDADDGSVRGGSGDDPESEAGDEGAESGETESESDSDSDQEPGDQDADGHGTGSDPGDDGDPSDAGDLGDDPDAIGDDDGYAFNDGSEDEAPETQEDGASGAYDAGDQQAGIADNTGPEGQDAGSSVSEAPEGLTMGGKSGSESGPERANDPWTGKSDLQDDPTRRKNAKKDALDDLEDENSGQTKVDDNAGGEAMTQDLPAAQDHLDTLEKLTNIPEVENAVVPDYQARGYEPAHAARTRELSPVISRLKKILRFRNADWGGQQTGRRAGTLTRRHVARLSALGSDKVFHKTLPDATPKVRIALLIDESDSMNAGVGGIPRYVAAVNAATALTQALHGIRGVKLWSWGYSLNKRYGYGPRGNTNIPTMRNYVDPFHPHNPAAIEITPMFGGTPTGEAMDYAADVITKNSAPDEKKVIFIITDGESGGYVSTSTAVRKWLGKVTFVHIGIGHTVDDAIPYYIGPVTDIALLPDLLSESAAEILR